MDRDFLLKRYDNQLERRDKLTAAVNFPTTSAIFLGSVLVTMAKALSHDTEPLTIGFFGFALGATAAIGTSLFYLSRVYHGQRYNFIPRLQELEEVLERTDPQSFDEALREAMIESTDENTESNDTRQAYLDRANVMLLVSVSLTGCTGVLYALDQIFKK
jgi:hypothetical protein